MLADSGGPDQKASRCVESSVGPFRRVEVCVCVGGGGGGRVVLKILRGSI